MHPILFLCSDSEIKGGGQVSLLELVKRIDRSKYLPRAIVGAHGPLFDAFVKEQVSVEAMALPRIAPFPGPGAAEDRSLYSFECDTIGPFKRQQGPCVRGTRMLVYQNTHAVPLQGFV